MCPMPIHLCIVYGYIHTTMVELSYRLYDSYNIYYLAL